MADKVWLTWETQRRNRTTSAALGAALFELDGGDSGLRRYLRAITQTLGILRRERPRIVFAQNPSIVLAMLAVVCGRLTSTPVVIDAHNAGVHPREGCSRWANALARRIMRAAALTLVSNEALASHVTSQGGRPFVLPDPLPDLEDVEPAPMYASFDVLFICTWAADEPYLEVLAAASRLPADIQIHITGNSKGREQAYGKLPPNVTLTGFVSEAAFIALLRGADLIVDLTIREHCLVCGAYEAVAAEKPLLVSDTAALRAYFHTGVLYTDNSAADIANRIVEARENTDLLRAEIKVLKKQLVDDWRQRQAVLQRWLDGLESHSPHVADAREGTKASRERG